jgi:acyl-CoA reductase-like NAD-dependent aldehyde dehydrogenase
VVGTDDPGDDLGPTIVMLPREALGIALWTEETFAPVRGLTLARDEDDAVALANDSRFALGAAVFGGSPGIEHGLRAARVVVGESALYQDPYLVVGGVGDSGIAGARPKLEQLTWARRTHRGA